MTVNAEGISEKISEIYPEIAKYGIQLEVSFDNEKDAWIIRMTKGENELFTHLEKLDAEKCIEGEKCVYFGNQLSVFIEAYCLGGNACKT